MKKSTKKAIGRLWGYPLLAIVLYCPFQAPMWCCAETRNKGPCRNNASGILLGCYPRQHKGQKLKMAIHHQEWNKLAHRVLTSVGGKAAALSALAGMLSALVATVTLIAK